MATKYWQIAKDFFWMDEDGEKQTSAFLYIGNDGRFYYQSDFDRFDEIDKVFIIETGEEADRMSLFDDACADDMDFNEIERGEAEFAGKMVPYIWEARNTGNKIEAVLLAEGDNGAGSKEFMEPTGPGWFDEKSGSWFKEGDSPSGWSGFNEK